MKRLRDKARAAKWSSLFGRTVSIDQIKQAVTRQTPFADDIVAGLSELIGLRDGQPQINYRDFLDNADDVSAEFHFNLSQYSGDFLTRGVYPYGLFHRR
jgi:hypothetical protein